MTQTWDPFRSTHPDQSSPSAPFPGPPRPSTAAPDPTTHAVAHQATALAAAPVPRPAQGVHTPPPGWYPTAEGGHERYWDGVNWSAPRIKATPIVTHPAPAPEQGQVELPDHPYRDLPAYAAVPPYTVAVEAFVDAVRMRDRSRSEERALFSGTGWAWPVALWPAVWVVLLVVVDLLTGLSSGTTHDPVLAAATHPSLTSIALWSGPVVWILLAFLDTLVVRGICPRPVPSPVAGRKPKQPEPMGRHWALVPPLQALVRASAAKSSRFILVCMMIAMLFPVVWFAPMPSNSPEPGVDEAAKISTDDGKKKGNRNRPARQASVNR